MSGGSHNYICHEIDNELVGRMHDRELNALMEDVAKLAHDLEWYDSGDYGKDTYTKTVREFKKKWFDTSHDEILAGFIEEAVNELRGELLEMIGKGDENP